MADARPINYRARARKAPRYPAPTVPDDFDPEKHLRNALGLPADKPVDLWALQDPSNRGKPEQPLQNLVTLAIFGSPNKMLTLKEIYAALIDRFDWFKDQEDDEGLDYGLAWKVCRASKWSL